MLLMKLKQLKNYFMNIGQVRIDPSDNETIQILSIEGDRVEYKILVKSELMERSAPPGTIFNHSSKFVLDYYTRVDETWEVQRLLEDYESGWSKV
jgi:hypothetical protein